MKFKSEKDLLETTIETKFFNSFSNKYYLKLLIEPTGLFGIPDVVLALLDSETAPKKVIHSIAFEMKLSNWKRALIQAYKYRAFSEYSYVILDNAHINPAIKNIEMFQTSNIGLLSININGDIEKHYKPRKEKPYSSNNEATASGCII